MELQAKARHLPFMTASTRLNDRFGISYDDDTFIERAYFIWREIGNIAVDLKVANITIGMDLIVTLPQDCEFVRSLTTTDFKDDRSGGGSFGDYKYTPKGRMPGVKPDPATTSVEANVRASDSMVAGESISYKTYDGYLKLESPVMAGRYAALVYNSIVTGEDGLPLLNDIEVEAIAVTLALREAEKELFRSGAGFNTRTGQAAPLVTYLKAESDRLMVAAKAPEKLSDDGLDKMLDVQTSFGRKVFGKRFNFY
jgi:hypothetical protein